MAIKQTVSDLAAFGGPPAFRRTLHVGQPNIADRERFFERMNDAFDRRWLTNRGRYVQEFEAKLASITGAKHCIAVSNATIGLQVLAQVSGLSGEVIVPSFTFVATAHAMAWQGLRPVFCDVAPGQHHLDPECVERLITPRTSAILGVHVWGETCDVQALETIARRHGLKLFFDAAHAFACSHGGRMVGNLGLAEVFSFHATKFINAFEGGAVCTNDDELTERIRAAINFGYAGSDDTILLGTNGKMSEASAAMGLTNCEHLDELVAVNERNYLAYHRHLAGVPGVVLRQYDRRERRNYQYIVLEIDRAAAGVSRDQLVELLKPENILARRYFYPGVHSMEPYRSSGKSAACPLTEQLAERVCLLPTGTAIDVEDVISICQIIKLVVTRQAEVNFRLAESGKPETPPAKLPPCEVLQSDDTASADRPLTS